MKRIYLTLALSFLAGHLMAQKSTTNSNSTVKQSSTVSTNGVSQIDLPGFPVYQNTGNKELDDANYAIAKEKWIKENPELYNNYFNKSSFQAAAYDEGELSKLPGFPQYVNTGDESKDKQTYLAAREKWIKENQELYNNYLNSIK